MPDQLRILVVHNRYQQYGGEDSVVEAEIGLLRAAGHDVTFLAADNEHITGVVAKAKTAALTIYNPYARDRLKRVLAEARPDVVHVHNMFPTLSASIFDACREAGVPAVWTLHNFRVACANAFLFRDGKPCEDCLEKSALHAVLHRCYRNSLFGSMTLAASIGYHQAAGTWRNKVTRFVALTDFSRQKLLAAGLPVERVTVKPNFVPDPLAGGQVGLQPAEAALFIGRLSVEKGVKTLVEAWREVDAPLRIVGDGPEGAMLREMAPPHVQFLGRRSREEVFAEIAQAAFVVVPSLWYENFPMTVVEVMAMGKPILASDIGALREIVTSEIEGAHFAPGDPAALAAAARAMLANPDRLQTMGANARRRYLRDLSPERNLEMLVAIYRDAMREAT
ncbi:glycosyltransferase [Sphingosinithalassobacter sp. CS137]|uniref:glycosyltransferase n=1 Tax=Sphingosinithalassobacter sp. CS137 TaxID=2762748 RepID=UPI00165E56B9|nr:glycosyltransferase [Sphingosinithalassobacter sp. CS137]